MKQHSLENRKYTYSLKNLPVLFVFLLVILSHSIIAQEAVVKGVVLDESNRPVANANVSYETSGTKTDENGVYVLNIPANKDMEEMVYEASRVRIQGVLVGQLRKY